MGRLTRGEKNAGRGERFRDIWRGLFPGQPRAYAGEMLGGVSGGTIRNWELGGAFPETALERLRELGVSLDYLLRGEGSPMIENDGEDAAAEPASEAADPRRIARIIGANLKHIRKQRFPGWGGQKKFADFLGLSPNDLCVYEYGRSAPNEHRIGEIAARLGMTLDELRAPLPDVVVAPVPTRPASGEGSLAGSEKAWRAKVDELKRSLARLEGRLEAMEEQNAGLNKRIEEMREENFMLRSLLYGDDSPEAKKRRQLLFEHLTPAIVELVKRRGAF